MKRRSFLKHAAIAGLAAPFTGKGMVAYTSQKQINEVTYNQLPYWRGFNLQEKFTHKPDEWLNIAPEWGFNNEPFKESDFELISELGFNFVRLPMSYKCWCEEHDWYKLKEKHLKEIDQAVRWGKQYGLHVAINFHRSPGYTINDIAFKPEYAEKTSIWDDEKTQKACAYHWKHFAERYKGIPSSQVSFNLFNEPVRTTEEKHDRVVRYLVNEIWNIDPDRLIVIDGFNFRPSTNLVDLKIAQCARGYAPGEVTHYKAAWASADDKLPTWPMKMKSGEIWNKERLVSHFSEWKEIEEKGVGVYVGEFGVYNQTPHDVSLAFLKDNLAIWKENHWGWAMWCFRGSFGVANSERKDVKYEKYKGVLLDRKMVELLQSH